MTAQEARPTDGETVLFDELPTSHSGTSADVTYTEEDEDYGVIRLIKKHHWEDLLNIVSARPKLCLARFFADDKKGSNLLLHQMCKVQPPVSAVDRIIEYNKDAVKRRDEGGYLPLHIACANNASADVIACLLGAFQGSILMVENTDRMLPLHLASKFGISEDSMMVLLSSFPEAMMVKDAFGRTPMDFARSQTNAALRSATISYLERGGWLCSATASARHWAELALKKQMEKSEGQMETAINQLTTEHKEEERRLEGMIQTLEIKLVNKQDMIDFLEKTLKEQTSKLDSEIIHGQQMIASLKRDFAAKEADLKEAFTKMEILEVSFGEKAYRLKESYESEASDMKEGFATEKKRMNLHIKHLSDKKAALEEETSKQATRIKRLEDVVKGQGLDFDEQLSIMTTQISNLQHVLGETKIALEQSNTKLVRAAMKNNDLNHILQRREADDNALMEENKHLRSQIEHLVSLMTSISHLSSSRMAVSSNSREYNLVFAAPTKKTFVSKPKQIPIKLSFSGTSETADSSESEETRTEEPAAETEEVITSRE